MNFTAKPSYYQVGGSLTNNAPNYVKRQADDDFYNGLKAGEFCYVLNSRQMGKSSLQVRTIQRLRNEGIACAAIDISEIGNRGVTPEQWYAGLLRILENNFNLSDIVNVRTWWRDRNFLTPVQRLSEFIETVLLANISTNIVIFIDEIDSILALDFPADDFLSLIRSCYNKRANNSEFDRLTWALLGVASPTDLCRDKNLGSNTPFNIGRAIELTGFDETEAEPLAAGLAELTDRSGEVLREVLYWTGGQPFLTQKLCKLLFENAPPPAPPCQGGEQDRIQNPREWVEKVVRLKIVENWESQDVPEHLSTIRDRLFRENQRIIRRLGLYQQILQQVETVADGSAEQMELRLSGLIVKRREKLTISNPIYQAVFNEDLIARKLEKLSPYSEAIKVWLNSNSQDDSQLLRGDDLQSALVWAADKSLRNEDFQFLTASQKLILTDQNQLLHSATLETQKAARDAATALSEAGAAKQKAQQWIGIGSAVLAGSLIGAIGFSTLAYQRFKLAQASIEIEQNGSDALLLAVSQKNENSEALSEALLRAIASGKNLRTLVENKQHLEQYPATRPLLALQVILDKISNEQQIKAPSLPPRKMNWQAHTGAVTSISFSRDGKTLATVGIDDRVRIWNFYGQKVAEWKALQQSVNMVSFSPDGKFLATAGKDSTVKFWNLSGKNISQLKGIEGSVNSISFSPERKLFAAAGIDSSSVIWDLSKPSKLTSSSVKLPGHNGLVRNVNFSPSGNFLTTLDGKSTVRVWDLSGQLEKTLPVQVIGISFSPAQQQYRFATVTLNGKVGLWNLSEKELVSEFETLHLDAKSISFSPDGERLATVGIDKTVRLWNLAGRQVAQFEFEENVVSVGWSGDGKQIAVAGSNGTVWLRQVEGLEELLKQSCDFLSSKPEYLRRVSTICK
ncbi:MAG: AAA-like domain-containing protein [Microcoleus sp. PH2017_22_RUC_O_B]|uniref:AAA-like domain-containing protein n=1 Tax=unclassified Microcoleus TaxID=2642155 RepID=UPI001D796FDB|nr:MULTISPECIES: AAA-like domain-containing protein [unclassified Microcoleus]MCC3531316.1 AAA-like domain-containing protein [Microcoleus sp. PH2017_21_RUC_O_A]MCC3543593.1 AAA-like domain-containing protein [Microcoleus sp. PH2017_22_RUC_O_B]